MSRYDSGLTPCGQCGATPTRWIAAEPRCRAHWPAQPKPDPSLTLNGLRAAAGIPLERTPEGLHATEPGRWPVPAAVVPPGAQRAVERATARAVAMADKRLKHSPRPPSTDVPERYEHGE